MASERQVGTTTIGINTLILSRVITFGSYVLIFYALQLFCIGALWALVALVGGTACATFLLLLLRDGETWHDSTIGALLCTSFCGELPFLVVNDQRMPEAPGWAGVPFILCLPEAAFFLSALGVFGATMAGTLAAIAVGMAVFAFQSLLLGIGSEFA